MENMPIRTVLISVSDKSGLESFACFLHSLGCRILSSGGTAAFLQKVGIEVTPVSEWTGFPEMLDGRIKTLHPKIHGGLLAVRSRPDHLEQLQRHQIPPIDMVVVNLYPFVETAARPGRALEEVVENIDIGGPSMVRSAAKNFEGVAVATDPEDYPGLVEEMQQQNGSLTLGTRLRLARKAFAMTFRYDRAIHRFLEGVRVEEGVLAEDGQVASPTEWLDTEWRSVYPLRYGENPHQKAAFYRDGTVPARGLAAARILQGKEISYNNLLDLDAALALSAEFQDAAAVIIKHTNPCGCATAEDLLSAFRKAHEADPVSAFGSVIALNRLVDRNCAEAVCEGFVEVLAAPGFDATAREVFQTRKNLRLLEIPKIEPGAYRCRSVAGGILIQDEDRSQEDARSGHVVTQRTPSEAEWLDLDFAWKVVKHVKSNAIVLACGQVTSGVGAGQMSRVESVEIATRKAGLRAAGSVLGSDAFFPFRDGIDAAAKAGVRAVIQPGGSKRDDEVIAAANEHGMAMIFTGHRHFRH